MADWREGYVAGGPTRFFVRVLGQGDDLVLALHGWPETGRAWRHVAPRLVEAGYRVACPDLKGFGRSAAPRSGYDSQTLADEVARLISALHVRKAVVVGHDWGGAVALATAFRHPGRVRALAVVNSPYRQIDLRHAWHIPLFNIPVAPELAFKWQAERLVRGALTYGAAANTGDGAAGAGREATDGVFPDEVVREYAEAIANRPHGWLAYYRTLSRGAFVDRVRDTARRWLPIADSPHGPPRLRVPTAVVWGSDDPVLPLHVAEATARDLNAPLVAVPHVGHFPHEEAPEAVAEAIVDLTGHPAASDADDA